jgi:hypothetical protein
MTQQPHVDVLIDHQQVATIQLGLSLIFDLNALVARIRAGRLVAIHTGHCDVTATLAIQGRNVLTKPTRIQLPGVIPFTPGIRLLSSSEYLAAENISRHPRQCPGGRVPGLLRQAIKYNQTSTCCLGLCRCLPGDLSHAALGFSYCADPDDLYAGERTADAFAGRVESALCVNCTN